MKTVADTIRLKFNMTRKIEAVEKGWCVVEVPVPVNWDKVAQMLEEEDYSRFLITERDVTYSEPQYDVIEDGTTEGPSNDDNDLGPEPTYA